MSEVLSTTPRRRLSVNSIRLACGIFITMILSLSVHVIASESFQVPVPLQDVKTWLPYRFVADLTFACALVTLHSHIAAGASLTRRIRPTVLCLLIILGLNETLRGWFMDAYCSTPFSNSILFYAFMTAASSLYFVLAGSAVGIACIHNHRSSAGLAIVLVTGVGLFFFAPSVVSGAKSLLFGAFQSIAPTSGWCKLPYGADVLIPAYLTFIEPVLAAILLAAVTYRKIEGTMPRRLLHFTLLVLALKNQLFALPLYLAYSSGSWWVSIASMGQFTLEAVVLAICAFLIWGWVTVDQPNR